MKPLHFAVVGAVLLVVALLLFLQDDDDGGHRRARTDDPSSRTSLPVTTKDGDTKDGGGDATPEGAGTLSVSLLVVDADGAAVLDAQLSLTGPATHDMSTDERGAGKFLHLRPGFYDLTAREVKGSSVRWHSSVVSQQRSLAMQNACGEFGLGEETVLRINPA